MNYLVILVLVLRTFSCLVFTNSTYAYANEIVQYGSVGKYASKAQELLKKHGYYSREITGNFDDISVNATLNYQRAQCIPDTGIVNSETWDRLLRDPQVPVPTALPKNIKKDEVTLVASKSQRKLFYLKNGKVKKVIDVRFGGLTKDTSGKFRIFQTDPGRFKVKNKDSHKFSHLWSTMMLYCIMTKVVFIHYSTNFAKYGYDTASHGCINIRSLGDAKWFYEHTPMGATVIVY